MRALVESALDVSPRLASQALELSQLVSAPRLREAAVVSALASMGQATRSRGFARMRDRNPRLVAALLDRALARNDEFFGVLESAGGAARGGGGGGALALAAQRGGKRGDPLTKLLRTAEFPWRLIAAIAVLFVAFIALAEYNVALTPLVPFLNVGVLVLLGVGL